MLLFHLHKVQHSGDGRDVKGILQANLQHEAPKSALASTSSLQMGRQEGTSITSASTLHWLKFSHMVIPNCKGRWENSGRWLFAQQELEMGFGNSSQFLLHGTCKRQVFHVWEICDPFFLVSILATQLRYLVPSFIVPQANFTQHSDKIGE